MAESSKPRRLKVIGSGDHWNTRLLDAETGEDVGRQLGVTRIRLAIGEIEGFPRPRVTLELGGPVAFEIEPSA